MYPGLLNFGGTPDYLKNGKSYGFQTWPVYSQGPSIKILEKRERGRIQGLPKFFRVSPIHRAHRAVIFAIDQLSCIYSS